MNQPPIIRVEVLKNYSGQDAAMIGTILPDISERSSTEPIAEQLLRSIIDNDLVVSQSARRAGVGDLLWQEIIN